MDSGWFIIGGTGVGAVIGFAGTLLVDRLRWRRDTRTRRDEARLDAYSRFEGVVLYARDPGSWAAVGSARSVVDSVNAMKRDLTYAFARVNLLATSSVKATADTMADAAMQDVERLAATVSRFNRIPRPLPAERHTEFQRLRIDFERAVREERGED